jgi:preprotein translocase subunit SecF
MPFALPHDTKFDFIAKRWVAFALTGLLILISIVAMATRGLNYGIDFDGGILIEARTTQGPADVHAMRVTLSGLGLGEVALQGVGTGGSEVLIRVQRQEGGEKAQSAALDKVKAALGSGVEYRRVELVGPKVGEDLKRDGALALGIAIVMIAMYIWFRFEWQFGVGAVIATFHDVITTFGFYSVFGLEFNLTSVAAILTIAGFSINDTVVEYDRVRENMRKYKSMPLYELLNLSVNETLSRTILTSGTMFLSALALALVGGEVLHGFSLAILWGVVIGTYSSIYVAMPILIYFNLRSMGSGGDAAEEDQAEEPAAG